MRKSDLLPILERLGLHPSRSLGQNFLVDDNCLEALVRAAAPLPGEAILEIGPGTGVLTERLLEAGCRVTAVELDSRLYSFLAERHAAETNLRLLHADACRLDYGELFPEGSPFRVVANLPYSCASQLLAKLADLKNPPGSFHVLLQLEMAERLAATVGTKSYGSLTARLALRYTPEIVRRVPRGVFFPPPEIDSAFLRMTRLATVPEAPLLRRADMLIQAAFSQRRKQARKLLGGAAPAFDIATAFKALQIPDNARAEEITPFQYLELARMSEG
ncbi:MAG: ribosomal RNA small subunit methyltransferase A [Victivallales bacterium]|nr:ribosomal RNA small subunit methyltransferase A [Victivallales bacterium]